MFPGFSYSAAQSLSPFLSPTSFSSHYGKFPQCQLQPKQPNKKRWRGTYEVGGGYPDEGLRVKGKNGTARQQGSPKLEPVAFVFKRREEDEEKNFIVMGNINGTPLTNFLAHISHHFDNNTWYTTSYTDDIEKSL
ncbi:hypothetical protein DVH24_010282 [Malus domestica]|uniref:Uncharacterized protein n=1 Tax=Malus domestica TaxID=3750 RepID=A0A498JSN7_MALDO|nr:hypothetical protein DVH24_010282 [Malus domestica]